MKGFHIDMNGLLFRKSYLKKWLNELASMKYDTILWELENGVQWETCPECWDEDALTKQEFKELLAYSNSLGFENIPLLQTIGHAEYVFKSGKYNHLVEREDTFRQYCPSKPATLAFLHKWIEEYLELFGETKYFHLGADEAYDLGFCTKCKEVSDNSTLSDLYIDYINKLIKPVTDRNIQPIIWCDMFLHHFEAIPKLDRRIMIFDWIYRTSLSQGKIQVWGQGHIDPKDVKDDVKKVFGKHIFPENSNRADLFYTSHYLIDEGFDVVICPASASYGDTVFAPAWFHMENTFDYVKQGINGKQKGFMLTSWTVHLLPYELQRICIAMNKYLSQNANGTFEEYLGWYADNYYNGEKNKFWDAIKNVAQYQSFAMTQDTAHSKSNLKVTPKMVSERIESVLSKTQKTVIADELSERLTILNESLKNINSLKVNEQNKEEITYWKVATANLISRAKTGLAILNQTGEEEALQEAITCRKNTATLYENNLQPIRLNEVLSWLFLNYEAQLQTIHT